MRLDYGLAAVAVAHAVIEILDLHELAGSLQILDDALAAFFLDRPAYGPASTVMLPSSSMHWMNSRPWRSPSVQSLGSWQG